MKALSVKNLVKKYGDLTAVNDISFDVEQGKVFAFLGTNGSGKSTTIGCITSTLKINGGTVMVNGLQVGKDDDAIKNKIGVVFQASLLDDLLTVKENIVSRAAFYNLDIDIDERVKELSSMLELDDFLDRRYDSLSGGQKRRADIARALVHKPSVLFLDEPTAGLDPSSRENVWKTVYDLQKKTGLTVFLTTHYMEETERADDVFIIHDGQYVAGGTPSQLRSKYSKDQVKLVAKDKKKLLSLLKKDHADCFIKNDTIIVNVDSSKEALKVLNKYKLEFQDFEFVHGNMDDVFIELTRQGKEA